MNREEAIEILKQFKKCLSDVVFDEKGSEAWQMAIQSLSQEPCDDGISRLDKIRQIIAIPNSVIQEDVMKYKMICEVMKDELPSVTQKSETVTEFADRCRECGKMRKGHWIYDETVENWRCSKCNETPKTMGYVGTADFMAEHFKFCNHCGAKMESEEISERNMKMWEGIFKAERSDKE